MSNDKKTTLGGVVLAALIAGNIDYNAAMQGNVAEICKAAAAVVVAAVCWFINRPDKPKV